MASLEGADHLHDTEESDEVGYYKSLSSGGDIDSYGLLPGTDSIPIVTAWTGEFDPDDTSWIPTGGMTIVSDIFEDEYEHEVVLFSSIGGSTGASDPTLGEWDEYVANFYYATVTYDSYEDEALKTRFGAPNIPSAWGDVSTDQAQTYLEDAIENIMNTLVEDIFETDLNPQFTFKKLRYENLDYDQFSIYDETEVGQTAISSLTQTMGYGGASGISED